MMSPLMTKPFSTKFEINSESSKSPFITIYEML